MSAVLIAHPATRLLPTIYTSHRELWLAVGGGGCIWLALIQVASKLPGCWGWGWFRGSWDRYLGWNELKIFQLPSVSPGPALLPTDLNLKCSKKLEPCDGGKPTITYCFMGTHSGIHSTNHPENILSCVVLAMKDTIKGEAGVGMVCLSSNGARSILELHFHQPSLMEASSMCWLCPFPRRKKLELKKGNTLHQTVFLCPLSSEALAWASNLGSEHPVPLQPLLGSPRKS